MVYERRLDFGIAAAEADSKDQSGYGLVKWEEMVVVMMMMKKKKKKNLDQSIYMRNQEIQAKEKLT